MIRNFLFIFLIPILSDEVYAYPQFVGQGYNSCIACHHNPYGAGAINDYGRALSAGRISGRAFRSHDLSDEQLAEKSGFFYTQPDTSWIRPALKYRGLALKNSAGSETSNTEYIHMLARAQMTLQFGEQNQLILTGNIDYAPDPRGGQIEEEENNFRSREHYIGYRPFPSYGIYIGLMDKAFGVRIPDHIAFSRTVNALTMNDQSHGILNHFLFGEWELGLHYFIGNLAQDEPLRQKGVSSVLERAFGPRLKAGVSFLNSSSDFTEITSMATQAKIGFDSTSSLVLELGQRERKILALDETTTSRYIFGQGHIYLRRGLFFINTLEYLKRDTDQETSVLRIGPGIQYFLTHGLELRGDIYNTRIFSQENVSDDVWDLTLQVHLWF